MSLREYARKRKFEDTPEPPPGKVVPRKEGPFRFFVQRHDATRLHYDFRLEIGGTLKSWAVPKGPSLDPSKKLLAMHVEDHPLDYGPFEGNIPKGNYGAGSVMQWDAGTYELIGELDGEAQMKRGEVKFRLHGQKLNGEFVIVLMKGRGKGNEWLLIKKKDEFAVADWDVEAHAGSITSGRSQEQIASNAAPVKKKDGGKAGKPRSPSWTPPKGAVKTSMPADVVPMTAHLVSEPPEGEDWLYEIKWDGVRALCYVENGQVRFVSRNGNSFDRQYPELAVLPDYLDAGAAIVDGEIAVLDEKGRSSFGLIQPRIHQTDPAAVSRLAKKHPATLFLFDLLYKDGYDLRSLPLLERKQLLQKILTKNARIKFSEHFETGGSEMLHAASQAGLEGIMAKLKTGKYESRRSRSWLKVKVTGRQEFVICGFTEGERDYFSSLVLGVHDNDRLRYAGNVGTGFNEESLKMLWSRLKPLITPKCPFEQRPKMLKQPVWVKPELVAEIKFVEWTKDNKLRAPVFLGLREDKAAGEAVKEEPDQKAAPVSIPARGKEASVEIDGHVLKFTNLDKVLFPKDKLTKRDLLNYYDGVAEWILPHLHERPLSLKRYPNGIHHDFFFQKDTPDSYPDWLKTEDIPSEHRGEPIRYIVANDRATLLYLTNLGCIDQNPWMSRIAHLDSPDFLLIDLDPQECPYDLIIEAALLVKKILDKIELTGYPKTTGGDGMHIYVPLETIYSYDQVRSFAEILSQIVVGEQPDLFTTPRAVAKRRKGRVYFDAMQIGFSKTIAAPYVVRPRDGAPVATPLEWKEVKPGLTPEEFQIRNALERFHRRGDLFRGVLDKPQRLEGALQKLSKLLA